MVGMIYSELMLEKVEMLGGCLFGTSGIRGVVGKDVSVDFCREVAQAIGTMLAPHSRVCIGTDTRVSREILKGAVVSGLCSAGIDVADLGILPTPVLALLTHTRERWDRLHENLDYRGRRVYRFPYS